MSPKRIAAERRETVLTSHLQSKLLIPDQKQYFIKAKVFEMQEGEFSEKKGLGKKKTQQQQREQAQKGKKGSMSVPEERLRRVWRKTRLPHTTPPTQTVLMKFNWI